jgi:hypothetical protein
METDADARMVFSARTASFLGLLADTYYPGVCGLEIPLSDLYRLVALKDMQKALTQHRLPLSARLLAAACMRACVCVSVGEERSSVRRTQNERHSLASLQFANPDAR